MNCSKEEVKKIIDAHWEEQWEHVKSIDLPNTREYEIKEERLLNEFKSLCKNELNNKSISNIIHVFYPSIVTANRGGSLSPVEFWKAIQENPDLFKKFYENRLLRSDWFNEKNGKNREFLNKGIVPDFIYAIGCTTGRFAEKVSTFKPACAKNILNRFAPEAETVIDCFSGYGGRLLGTLAAKKKYIGYDINDITVAESKKLINWIETNFPEYKDMATVDVKDAFTSNGKADVFFSCPPYLRKDKKTPIEIWESSSGKIICLKDSDEIIDYILRNYDCKKYIFVFDSQEGSKYSKYVKENLENINYINARNNQLTKTSHNYEDIIVITKEERDAIIK